MKILILFLLLFHRVFFAFGQITVRGMLTDENDEPLPGATIQVKSTEIRTQANFEGEFEIECKKGDILLISFVGFETKEVEIKTKSLQLQLIPVQLKSGRIIGCFLPPPNFLVLGLNSGINHNQLGVELENFNHRLLKIPVDLTSNLKWRFLTQNQYLDASIKRNLFYIDNVPINLQANFKYLSQENSPFWQRQYGITPDFDFKWFGLGAGYAYRKGRQSSESSISEHGVRFGIYKRLFRRFDTRFDVIRWESDWQYEASIYAFIPKTHIKLGTNYERISDWKEVSFSLLYQFGY